MAKLIEITGKALSGEWGKDDETGNGIPVLRTTNFTNEGVIDYNSVVTRTITKKNIGEKFLRKGDIIIEKSGGSEKLVGLYILMVMIIHIFLIILLACSELKNLKYGIQDMYFIHCLQIISVVEPECLKIRLQDFII